MLTVLAYAAVAAAVAVAALLALAARRPDTFGYARSTVIRAPAERIFPLIADPVAFNAWNPFNEDPSITGSYSGPPRGPGARYTFASRRAGTGYTQVVEEHAPRLLVVRLVMTKPMAADHHVEFRLEPLAEGTRVTWAMSGRMTFIAKVMNQVIDCERMCTSQFDKGLAKLKTIAERETVSA
jgi:uncharacterized protein YndB with AHSA1/START domain